MVTGYCMGLAGNLCEARWLSDNHIFFQNISDITMHPIAKGHHDGYRINLWLLSMCQSDSGAWTEYVLLWITLSSSPRKSVPIGLTALMACLTRERCTLV